MVHHNTVLFNLNPRLHLSRNIVALYFSLNILAGESLSHALEFLLMFHGFGKLGSRCSPEMIWNVLNRPMQWLHGIGIDFSLW